MRTFRPSTAAIVNAEQEWIEMHSLYETRHIAANFKTLYGFSKLHTPGFRQTHPFLFRLLQI